MSDIMAAVLPRADYSRAGYPTFFYKLRNKKALKRASIRRASILDLGEVSFKTPYEFEYMIEDGYFTADFSAGGLVIASAEDSFSEMIHDIKAQLCHAWDYYALEDDMNLTEDAVAIKKWLRRKMRAK